ncbi:MAG: response regulator transcription factor [Acidobacteriota bacterium]|nr:response regulator transcription factor [Acidobacteriota bacterium]
MALSLKPHQKELVYILESHPIAMSHLATLLRNLAFEIVPTSTSDIGKSALPAPPSVLVIDAGALPFPLLPYLVTIRNSSKDVKTLVIGRRITDDEICDLLFQGASGYIVYEKIDDEICRAVDAVLRGHVWAPSRVLERFVLSSGCPRFPDHYGHGGLTPRENEVVGLLQQRLTSKEIGYALGVSERTVRFHLHNIFDKLGVHDRYSVIDLARADGLSARPHDVEGTKELPRERQSSASLPMRTAA